MKGFIIFSIFVALFVTVQAQTECLPYSDETAIFEGQILAIYPKENTLEVLILKINRQWSLISQLLEGEEILIDSSTKYNQDCNLPTFKRGSILNFITRPVEERTNFGQRRVFIIPGGIIEKSSLSADNQENAEGSVTVQADRSPATSDETQSRDADGSEDPCRSHVCQPGAKCEVWNEFVSGSVQETKSIPICVCPTIKDLKLDHACDDDAENVCASNGQVFKDHCHMVQLSCIEKIEMNVLFRGKNLNPQECVIASETAKHQNVYNADDRLYESGCDLRTCQEFDYSHPVCTENGTVYGNQCVLNLHSCIKYGALDKILTKNLVLCEDYGSKYEICKNGHLCKEYARCSTDQSNKETCTCDHIDCSNLWPDRVCGDDGKTYQNRCHLIKTACQQQTLIKMQHRGFCLKDPCSDHECSWPGEECRVDGTNGKPFCGCKQECPAVFTPICGSDSVTYDSPCHLKRAACMDKKQIFVKHSGFCRDEDSCKRRGLICNENQVCSVAKSNLNLGLSKNLECVCPECPNTLGPLELGEPICGSDDKTYNSLCELHSETCKNNKDVSIQSNGLCDSCKNVKCDNYATCQMNSEGKPICICPNKCEMNYDPVCGSDGVSYDNECHLKVKSCNEQVKIEVKRKGVCKKCPGSCPFGQECSEGECVCRSSCPDPVNSEERFCGTDGKYYSSECDLNRQACLTGKPISIDTSNSACAKNSFDSMLSDTQINMRVPISICNCDKMGTQNELCDSKGQCPCKPGHTGKLCSECSPAFWRHKTKEECKECKCDIHGSISNICHKSNGQCTCKTGFVGENCETCQADPSLTTIECLTQSNMHISRKFEKRTGLMMKVPVDKFLASENCIGVLRINLSPLNLYDQPEDTNLLQIINPGDTTVSQIASRFSLKMDNLGFIIAKYANHEKPNVHWKVSSSLPIPVDELITIKYGLTANLPWLQIGEDGDHYHHVNIGTQINSKSNLLAPIELEFETMWIGNVRGPSATPGDGFQGCLTALDLVNGDRLSYSLDMSQIRNGDPVTQSIWSGIDPVNIGAEAPFCFKKKVDTQMLSSSICDPNPCLNNGTCKTEDNNNFKCECQPGWTGIHCDSKVTIVPYFNGESSFISLRGPKGKNSLTYRRLEIELDIFVKEEPGVIMAILSETEVKQGHIEGPYLIVYQVSAELIMISIRSGANKQAREPFTREKYDPEYGTYILVPVKPNEWISLSIIKRARSIYAYRNRALVAKNNLVPRFYREVPMHLRRKFTSFILRDSVIYFGSLPNVEVALTPLINRQKTFWKGAIQRVQIEDAGLVLAGKNSYDTFGPLETWVDITQYDGAPCGPNHNPCLGETTNDVCIPSLDLNSDGIADNKAQCKCATSLESTAKVNELLTMENIKEAFRTAQMSYESLANIAEEKICESKKMSNDQPMIHTKPNTNQYEDTSNSEFSSNKNEIYFNGANVFTFPEQFNDPKETDIQMQIKTRSSDGIIFISFDEQAYFETRDILKADFIMLAMRNGHAEVSLNLVKSSLNQKKSTLVRIQSERLINNHEWHELYILRNNARISLLVDNYVVGGTLTDNEGVLTVSDKLYFGGNAKFSFDTFPEFYQKNITACFSQFQVDQKTLDFLLDPVEILGPINRCPASG